ncbi:unnamed protein product [Pedinophyceae sp. YPF-701]|nr:unnamed protein product [Pedinophyceae sp. YPF-701]
MEQGNTITSDQPREGYGHPVTAFFHIAFKASAIAYYILSSFFGQGFVTDFVVCVVLLSLDFWVVKNVSGRLLVGLRWWNEVSQDGASSWRFESLELGERQINKKDSAVFWTTLYLTPLAWIGLGVLAFLKFSWDYLLIVLVAFMLAGSNLAGYYRCSRDQQAKVKDLANSAIQSGFRAAVSNAGSFLPNPFGGGGRQQQGPQQQGPPGVQRV